MRPEVNFSLSTLSASWPRFRVISLLQTKKITSGTQGASHMVIPGSQYSF